jgi:hypothetical protein
MKLIRLSENAKNVTQYSGDKLIFNTTFKDDLTVNSNAKIAFQSIYFDEFRQDLIIDATNDKVEIQIEGQDYEIFLNRDRYTSTTYEVFYQDFTNKLNKITPFNQDTYGREWLVEEDQNERLIIAFKYGNIGTANLELENVDNIGGVFDADVTPSGNDTFMYNRESMARATGALRARVERVGEGVLGVRLNPLNSGSSVLEDNTIQLGIGIDNAGKYVSWVNGTPTTTVISAAVDDIMEVRIDAGKEQILFYRANTENTLHTEVYLNDRYYPFVRFNDDALQINQFSFAANPYLDDTTKVRKIYNLAIPEPLPDPEITVQITFQNDTFAQIMGFRLSQLPLTQTNKQIKFKALDTFDGLTYNNLYAIRFTNTPLESYDGELQSKSQLLYIINKKSDGQDFNYTAPYLTFLDMKNDKPLSLRNIRCEVVDENDNIVEFYGKAIICLVIED